MKIRNKLIILFVTVLILCSSISNIYCVESKYRAWWSDDNTSLVVRTVVRMIDSSAQQLLGCVDGTRFMLWSNQNHR